jgi:hypothetical protein
VRQQKFCLGLGFCCFSRDLKESNKILCLRCFSLCLRKIRFDLLELTFFLSTNVQCCGFGGLEDACWPLVPKFAGSNSAEAVGFFRVKNDNTQHSQETNIHSPGGIRTHYPSRRSVADPRLRPRGQWDRPTIYITQTQF